jgi:hypothetical protein
MATASALNQEDILRRAYHNLIALRNNVPKGYIERKYADQFHHALDQLEQVGFDVREWRIPLSALREFQHQDLLTRLDAVLGYFTKYERETIGFKGPQR